MSAVNPLVMRVTVLTGRVQPHFPLSRKRHPLQAGAKGVMRQPMACLYLGDRVGVGNRLAFRNEGARSNALSNAL